ncbi:MAG: diphosphate--fructose-6-phosphate 1-phosphotransferase [Kiritimatiellae bacterium]|nr:diphosphate--fructose-6-phosphate 1-phosphotransferase [Kiritimatiellia bacterium]
MKQFRNLAIAQSGGPTMVINQSLVGAVLEARAAGAAVGRILGARHGIDGILKGDWIDLRKPADTALETVAATPSSALGSCRHKPDDADCSRILEALAARGVGYFLYIGGNDSADAARIVAEHAARAGVPLRVVHVPKTIDCDLLENDHTPGYGSAARFVACAFRGDDLDNRALGGVKIDIVMGRDAGFLTAASALARSARDDGPHLVYLPERPFSPAKFVADVKAVYARLGRCVVAVSEGIRDGRGTLVAAKFSAERDSHGNLQLSGSGSLGDYLAGLVKAKTGIKRVRADTFGYLQRTFPGIASETDSAEAREAGRAAVRAALAAAEGPLALSIAIKRRRRGPYAVDFEPVPVQAVAKRTRSMPDSFIAANGHDVTRAFFSWAAPLVGPLPPSGLLR